MLVSEFIENYPVKLATAEAVPLTAKIRWRLASMLHRPKPDQRPPYPTVSLSYWQPESAEFVNFGDELAWVIVALMLARRGATLNDDVTSPKSLVSVGSTLHRASEGSVIWGTGLHGASLEHDHTYSTLDVRAVRGPLTAKFLRQRNIKVPDVYGDPGLLLPHVDGGRFRPTRRHEVGIVPNLHDMSVIERMDIAGKFPNLRVIDPRRAWNTVVADILDHEFIIASSLHGLVVADAYGLRSRYVRLTEKEDILKYHDYYLGTGRFLEPAASIEEALKTSRAAPLVYDPEPLLAAFPWDLWNL